MAFSDLLTGDGLSRLFQNPAMLAGLQMLAQSGPQAGNPGFGARMGNALGNTATQLQQMQHSQALQQYRQQMIEQQQAEMQMRQQAAQAKADQLQRQQAAFADPAVQEQMGPLAKMLAAAGLGPDVVLKANSNDALQQHRQAQLAQQQGQFDARQAHQGGGGGQPSGPRMPTQRQVLEKPLAGGMAQRYLLDPQTGEYHEYGQPYPQYSPGRGKAKAASPATGADAALESILGADPAAAGPDASSLPGTGGLQSYMPQQQGPIGVTPMAAQGGGLAAQTQPSKAAGQAKIATPQTKADYDALPSGAQYIDPASGRVATKR
ncbi:hypothetical protein [Pseudomonas putida]|uniref:hypothetical protein n=1 Tax=Pseudomonas putida TaxID=303 RepID=UPI0015FBD9E2|nr:hypothetical protein [Pseudomonas putida]